MVFSSIPHQQQHQHQQQQQDCENKLDLNAPLMSVRRHGILHIDTATTTTSSSDDEQQQQFQQQWASPRSDFYTSSEAGGADMRSPGAVPFMWERTPGRPKLEPGDEHRAVACSPSLPPGRMPSPSRCSDPRRGAPALGNGGVLVVQQQQQQKQAMDGARKALLPFLLKESQHRKHKQSSLAQLFKRKAAVTPTSASASASDEQQHKLQQRAQAAEEDEDEDDEDGFSDAQQSENLTGMSLDPATTHNNNPAAERDFIMRRFLPAAKAMADESSASSSPFSSPIFSSSALNQQQQEHNQKKKNLPPSSPSTRQQVSASVERIQDCQYKFSSSGKRRTANEDDFAMKACGFFSFGLLRHLRPNYPSSRLRRASDRTNNRFASDDFQSSILVNKVKDIREETESSEGNQTEAEEDKQPRLQQQQQLRHFGRTDYKQLKSPNRLLDSPNRETFYDCDTSFFNRSQLLFSPQKVKTPERMHPPSTYYRGSMSPSPNNHPEAKGFLGLPENYRPPEDPYRNAGYSPRNGYLSSKRSTSNSEIEIERNSSSPMAARNQSSLAKRVGKDLWLNTENSNLGALNFESLSPGSRNGAPEESSELGWKMNNNARKSNGSPAVVTNGFGSNQGTSPRKEAEPNGRGWPTLKTSILDNSTRAPALSPAAAAALSPTAAAPLLPPKSPTQSWLGKSLPFASSHETKAKWEATVKSRQLRPGHLRYSEENALQPCEH